MKLMEIPNMWTVIEEGKMMMAGISCSSLWHFSSSVKRQWPPIKDGWESSYTIQFGPNHAEKCWRMEPGGHLCCFDNVPQDGVGVKAPAPNAGPHHSPPPSCELSSNGRRRRSGWLSTLESSPHWHSLGSKWENVVKPTDERQRSSLS